MSAYAIDRLRRPRRIAAMLTGGTRAAFGIGPGYEPQRVSTRAEFDRGVAAYFLDLSAKTLTPLTPFVSGRGHSYGISATTRAQRALGWWERHLAGDGTALRHFLSDADELLRIGDANSTMLLWRYEVPVPKYGRSPGWYSCMAQGQAASVLVRAWLATHDQRWADAARAAVAPMLTDTGIGILRRSQTGPVLEECPTDPASSILNGWMFGLWGLWDVGVALSDAAALAAFDEGVASLEASLPEYDLGWWSLYSLYPTHRDVATPFYHRAHCAQIDVMARLTGRAVFAKTMCRWVAYDATANRVRALTLKAAHAVRSLAEGRDSG